MMNRYKRVSALRRKNDTYKPLSFRRRWFADENTASTEPENVTGQNNDGSNEQPPDGYMSQDEVNAIMARTRKEARQRALDGLLGDLGVDSPDNLKAMLSDYEVRKQAEMSETDKALARAEKLERELAEARAEAEQAKVERETARRNRIISDALQKAGAAHADDLLLIASNIGVSFDDVFNEAGEPIDRQLELVVSGLKQARPNAFKSMAPGSPSNSGGRAPNPDKVAESVQKQILRKFGKL